MLLFGRMHAEAVVLGLDGRTAEQGFVYAVPERRNSPVLAVAQIAQIERPTKIGGESPEFGVSFDTGAEHGTIRTPYLITVLRFPCNSARRQGFNDYEIKKNETN